MHTLDFFSVILHPLNGSGLAYMVTGAAAVIVYGEPRMTHDLDLVLNLQKSDIPKFLTLFPEDQFYVPPAEVLHVETGRKHRGHFNLIHHDTGLRADIYLMGDDPLHHWAMKYRKKMIFDDSVIWLAPIEYVIIRKLEYYREGQSAKHLEDIRNMIQVSGSDVDRDRLGEMIAAHHLENEWQMVTSEGSLPNGRGRCE